MNEKFVISLFASVLFAFVMESLWRTHPSLVIFIGSALLSQMYWNSFEHKKKLKMIDAKPSNFAKAMEKFKK